MCPDDKVELLVANLTFASHVHPKYPLISMTRKKHLLNGSMTNVRDWFDRIISTEKARLPPNAVLCFVEYRILSGDTEVFEVDGFRYDKILLALSDELCYWNFFQNVPLLRRIEGEAKLPLAFCACCFQSHYRNVIRTIKDLPRSEGNSLNYE